MELPPCVQITENNYICKAIDVTSKRPINTKLHASYLALTDKRLNFHVRPSSAIQLNVSSASKVGQFEPNLFTILR